MGNDMTAVVLSLMAIGGIVALVGGIMFLIVAFRTGVGWGLGCLFLSFPVSLIFLVKYWQESKKSFFIQLAGTAVIIVAMVLGSQIAPVH
jgi:uncharacterized membrane protein